MSFINELKGLFSGDRKNPINKEFDRGFILEEPTSAFVDANIMREVSSIVDDILEPYIVNDKKMDMVENVYELGMQNIYSASLSLRDILMLAFKGEDVVVHRVTLRNIIEKDYFFVGDLDKEGLLELGKEKYKPLKSIVFEKLISMEELSILRLCFQALWYAYQRQSRSNKVDAKVIFKMKGFHATFTAPRDDHEAAVMEDTRKQIQDNYNKILTGNGGVIDADDDFGLLSSNTDASSSIKAIVDMIYLEIARILKVPVTRLVGRSPEGMNATGEGDAKNYEKTLDKYRTLWLEPFLKIAGVEYKVVDRADVDDLQKVIDMHIALGIEPSEELVSKIRAIGDSL
ncbi:MAG: anti-CBASS protein Acb1 family protein [Spirochaetia bacterium]